MRLIDADELYKYCEVEETKDGLYIKRANILTPDFIKSLPTVDAVPVVRCGECKHYEAIETIIGYDCVCTAQGDMNVSKEPDDYCSWGEKK